MVPHLWEIKCSGAVLRNDEGSVGVGRVEWGVCVAGGWWDG